MNAFGILRELQEMGLEFKPIGNCLAVRRFSPQKPIDEGRFGDLLCSLNRYHPQAVRYLKERKTTRASVIPLPIRDRGKQP